MRIRRIGGQIQGVCAEMGAFYFFYMVFMCVHVCVCVCWQKAVMMCVFVGRAGDHQGIPCLPKVKGGVQGGW